MTLEELITKLQIHEGKKSRFTGDWYNYGKPNHMARSCKASKKEDKRKGKHSIANVAQHELIEDDMPA
ncbi:hypothetical protein ACS0TY_014072 [Phlomoides rotata]